jgi:hypothetical protein
MVLWQMTLKMIVKDMESFLSYSTVIVSSKTSVS